MLDVRTPGALRKATAGSADSGAVLVDVRGAVGCRTVLVRGTERLRNDMVFSRVLRKKYLDKVEVKQLPQKYVACAVLEISDCAYKIKLTSLANVNNSQNLSVTSPPKSQPDHLAASLQQL